MASNNYIYKMSNAGGMATVTRYTDMLAGNTTWNPWSPDGAFDALATVTVPSGGLSSVTFAGIPNTYKHLQIRYSANCTATGNPTIRFNSDTGSNYAWHILYGQGTSAAAVAGSTQTFMYLGTVYQNTSVFNGGIIDVLDYANTNKTKTMRALTGAENNSAGEIGLFSGLWNSTAAINSITIAISNFTQNSQFTLYGVR
jgi:hypothetical protein